MKNWLSHTIVAVVAIVLTMLLMKQCSGVTTVTEEVIVRDTVITEQIVVQTDTIVEFRWKTRYDTVEKVVEVPVVSTAPEVEEVYAYSEFYKDSSLQVAGNIFYTGQIKKHDQMLITMKDKVTFIPTTTTIYRNRDVFTAKTIRKQPRLLLGSYLTAQAFTLQQLGLSVTVVDNRFREYTFGKDVLSDDGWLIGAKIPVFYTKK